MRFSSKIINEIYFKEKKILVGLKNLPGLGIVNNDDQNGR
jgi:hypothetical protein